MADKKKDNKKSENPLDISIRINEFGEIEHSFDIDKVNEFLNENIKDWRIQEDQKTYASNKEEEE